MSLFHVVVAVCRSLSHVSTVTLSTVICTYIPRMFARVLSTLCSDMIYSLGLIYYKPTAYKPYSPYSPYIPYSL